MLISQFIVRVLKEEPNYCKRQAEISAAARFQACLYMEFELQDVNSRTENILLSHFIDLVDFLTPSEFLLT